MQRSLLFALILLLCGAVGAAFWLLRGEEPPPGPARGQGPSVPAAADPAAGAVGAPPAAPVAGGTLREAAPVGEPDLLSDPEIRAGLCGFKGRVVDARKAPVADCGVRVYRGAMDSILPTTTDLFAPDLDYTPNYVAGETRTAADGTWLVTGVWPRGFYLLFAGIGTDAPMHQVLARTPAPGEIVDLGDIVLPDAGVIVGTVVDDAGEPLAGALVRAADLPGTLAAFFPLERFDPEGAVLVREPGAPVRVMVMPKWVKAAFEHLPIPTTRTDVEGRFRLVGVVPGSNLLATTASGFLSDVKPSLQVRPGQVRDAGTIRLKRGEEVVGKVLDTAGRPVAGAEVLAGSTLSMAPVDLAQRLGVSDADGGFRGQGFAPGKVSVAARRGAGHPWVLADPQPVLGEVVVTLPAVFGVDVAVTLADGTPAAEVRMQLLQGTSGQGAAEMHLLGLVPPVELRDRLRAVGEGRWRIDHLLPGSYTLLADAPGHAVAFAAFQVDAADAAVALSLTAPTVFTVRVVDADDRPVRNAAIFAEARGKRVVEMPVRCGRTRPDGTLVIDKVQAESLRVSAEHPRWGVVHGEVKLGQELLLRMQPPGALQGVVREDGKPPAPGKYSIAVVRQRGNDARGPLEQVPTLLTPDLEGRFAVKALQPGSYELSPIKALDALRSPGGIMAFAQDAMLMRDRREQDVQVVAGQVAEVVVEAGAKPIDGPTARLTGSVTIDGRLGTGAMVSVWGNDRRLSARADERGRFDLGIVPAGMLQVSVMAQADGFLLGNGSTLWSGIVPLAEGELRELAILVQTSSLSGVCYGPDGSPAAGVSVSGQGQLKSLQDGGSRGGAWVHTTTDSNGQFRFAQVAEGSWTLSVRGNRNNPVRGQLPPIEVVGGVPVEGLRLDLSAAVVVKGRVDFASFGPTRPRWAWLAWHRLQDGDRPDAEGAFTDGTGIDMVSGSFSTTDLSPGRYRVTMHAQVGDNDSGEYPCELIEVPATGLNELVLRPGPRKSGG